MAQQGSTISLLVHTILPEEPKDNLVYLWKEFQVEYIALNIPQNKRLGGLRMSMFSKEMCAPILAIVEWKYM